MSDNLEAGQSINISVSDRQRLQAFVSERLDVLANIAEVVGGPGASIEEIFELPEVQGDKARASVVMPEWAHDEDKVTKVRELIRPLGYGANEDTPSGVSGGLRLNDGGKLWKMDAQAESVRLEDTNEVWICASPNRPVGQDEIEYKKKTEPKFPSAMTEFKGAYLLASKYVLLDRRPGSKPDRVTVEDFGYETTEGNPMTDIVTGQLLNFGHAASGQLVKLLTVEGEQFAGLDAKDPTKAVMRERNRPPVDRIMGIAKAYLESEGRAGEPIVSVTSNTYAGRLIKAIIAGLENGITTGANMYGRDTIRSLGAPVPAETPVDQLPGDLRMMKDDLIRLQAMITSKQ